jgi:uncharacterized membrane protein YfcA
LPVAGPVSGITYSLLGLASAAGGAINSVAGGGTLLTFPALLAVVSPVVANGTSTASLVPAAFGSAWAYRTELKRMSGMLKQLWLPSALGGLTGSLLVTRFPDQFDSLVPWLILLASLLLLVQKRIAKFIGAQPHGAPTRSTVLGVTIFQYFVGVYGGYFGAGIGILMLSSLELIGVHDIHEMNALKVVLASIMNGVTLAVFLIDGVVRYDFAIVMALCSIAGGYLGARIAKRTPKDVVRGIVVVIGFGISAYAFYQRFG